MEAKNLKYYHEFSRKVSREFDYFLVQEIERRDDRDTIQSLYKKFLQRKFGITHQRVVHVFIAAKLFGIDIDRHLDDLLRLSAVPELLIWSEYALNWVTDGKNNETGTKYEENVDLIASQYLLTEALRYAPVEMIKRSLEVYRWGMWGFLTVERDLRVSNYEALRNDKTFWIAYSRNHCIPDVGALYAFCFELVQQYFNVRLEKDVLSRIDKIQFEFGRGLQVSGDLSDFMIPNDLVSTTEKRPKKDYFVDMRTDRLTYPIWLLLKSSEHRDHALFEEIIESAHRRSYPDDSFYWRVYKHVKENNIIENVLEFLQHEQKRLIKEIEKLHFCDGKELWKSSIMILTLNKFLKRLKEDYSLNT